MESYTTKKLLMVSNNNRVYWALKTIELNGAINNREIADEL